MTLAVRERRGRPVIVLKVAWQLGSIFIACAYLGCHAAELPSEAGRLEEGDAQAIGLVRDWISRRERTLHAAERFDPLAVSLRSDPSDAVVGMSYWQGSYAPPGTNNDSLTIAAARGPKGAQLLESPADWFRAARATGWRPASKPNVVEACVEVVSNVSRDSGAEPRVKFFRDSFSVYVGDAGIFPDSARAYAFRHQMKDVQVVGDSATGFTASFWMLEPGKARFYRCKVSTQSFELDAVDSLDGIGLFPLH